MVSELKAFVLVSVEINYWGGGGGGRGLWVSKQAWCLMSTETTRLIRDGEKGGGGGMDVGEDGDYMRAGLA